MLKLIIRADGRKLLGASTASGGIASKVVNLAHVVLHVGGSLDMFLVLALNTPTYIYAYHDAKVEGLARLTELMGLALAPRAGRHRCNAVASRRRRRDVGREPGTRGIRRAG